jgi:hypothetical protein
MGASYESCFNIVATSGSGKNMVTYPEAKDWFIVKTDDNGGYTIAFDNAAWKAGKIRPNYKYSITLAKGTEISSGKSGAWFGAKPLKSNAAKAFSVTRGKPKLARSPSSVTLYKAINHSSAEVTLKANGKPLPESAIVTISNAKYDIRPLGGGQYAIFFKGYKPAAKGSNVTLKVYLEGNYNAALANPSLSGYTANGSVTVKINLK